MREPVRKAERRKAKEDNFGWKLYKLSRQQRITGESLATAAKVLLDKWEARG